MLWWLSHGEGRDAVGINCKKGTTIENQGSCVKYLDNTLCVCCLT